MFINDLDNNIRSYRRKLTTKKFSRNNKIYASINKNHTNKKMKENENEIVMKME